MKEKVIETAGRAWSLLGQKGETSVAEIPKLLREKEEIVYQSLGWLAREDKINYAVKKNKSFVSLVEGELAAFKSAIQNIQSSAAAAQNQKQTTKRSSRRT